ncbi:MAG: hypothetical protein M3N49_05790, partial [Candidatus Eremiobacteraeota bacterium]|nr:hypothetical protein [Candidatus Eremiobacteraeota bacterium]
MTNLTGGDEPKPEQLLGFEESGLIVRFGTPRVVMMALNPAFPAVAELRKLIRAVEPKRPTKPTLPSPADLVVPNVDVDPDGPREMFGPWRQTAILLTIGNAGGEIPLKVLYGAMSTIRAKPFETRKSLDALAERGLTNIVGQRVRFHPKFSGQNALVAFARRFCRLLPQYALRTAERIERPQAPIREPGDSQRRHFFNVPAVGAPPIVGSEPRYRILAVLAVNGPLSVTDTVKAADVTDKALSHVVDDGFVSTGEYAKSNIARQAVAIASGITGRAELIALLRRIEEHWPVPRVKALHAAQTPNQKKTIVWAKDYFGSPVRSQVLMTIAAMGCADISMLRRAIPDFEFQEIARAARTWEAYGIVRTGPLDGRRARGFELNPDWYAAAELRALLDVLMAR